MLKSIHGNPLDSHEQAPSINEAIRDGKAGLQGTAGAGLVLREGTAFKRQDVRRGWSTWGLKRPHTLQLWTEEVSSFDEARP